MQEKMVRNNGILFVLLALAAISSISRETDAMIDNSSLFQYNFYKDSCPEVEELVWSTMKTILSQPENKNAPAQLLRLLFHDCFIEGCDASVLLNDMNGTTPLERQAVPNKTLKGFQLIDMIKAEIEKRCPGVVSCSDILVLATRDGIVLSGGPYYPLYTGRRDSNYSYFSKALAEIPRPNGNISETLRLFFLRGFNARETVALLGGHNIGKISCEFIKPRLSNFMETGLPDSSIPTDLLEEMRLKCQESNISVSNSNPSLRSTGLFESEMSMAYFQGLSSSAAESSFGVHYYQSLIRGRGLLFADQQLMADEETAKVVIEYATDDGTAFRTDFARVMMKISNLHLLTGSQGQVRLNCSVALNSV